MKKIYSFFFIALLLFIALSSNKNGGSSKKQPLLGTRSVKIIENDGFSFKDFNPSGKMPFSTPVSDQAVEKQKEDVPGYLEGEGYALFNYNEGISFKKK
jgi:hypothetical protein